MDFKLFEVWMTKPRGKVTADAKKVMPTSSANFLEGAWFFISRYLKYKSSTKTMNISSLAGNSFYQYPLYKVREGKIDRDR